MLTRTFAPDAYAEASAAGLAWDQAGYAAAEAAGLLRAEDGLPVTAEDLSGPIARQDAAVLLWRGPAGGRRRLLLRLGGEQDRPGLPHRLDFHG